MIMAFAAVIGGSFNRLGYATRMAVVAGAALVIRTLGFAVQAAAGGAPALNLLQYLLPLGAGAVAAAILLSARVGGARRAARMDGLLLAGGPA
jgi:lipopolysaccharide export system permease protein